jgi:hypothetical protein
MIKLLMPEIFLSSTTFKRANKFKFGGFFNETSYMQTKELPGQFKNFKAAGLVADLASNGAKSI